MSRPLKFTFVSNPRRRQADDSEPWGEEGEEKKKGKKASNKVLADEYFSCPMCGTIHHNSVSKPGVIYKLGVLVLLQKWKWTSRNEQFPRGRIEKAARPYASDLSSITPDSREAARKREDGH